MTQGRPVTVAGVTHPSFAEAERKHGIKRGVAEQRHFVYGWTLEEAFELVPRARPKTAAIAVCVEGTTYASLKAVAKAYGIEFSTLKKRVKKGLSIEAALELPGSGYRPPTKQLVVAGRVFESIAEACRAYGVGTAVFHNRVTNLGWTVEQALALEPSPNGDTSCLGRIYKVRHRPSGKAYIGLTLSSLAKRWEEHVQRAREPKKRHPQSLQAAILQFGEAAFTIELVACAHSTGELAELERHYIARFDTLAPNGYNLANGGAGLYAKGKSIRVGDTVHPSLAVACAKLGVSEHAVRHRMASGLSADEAFKAPVRQRATQVQFRDVEYASISALARTFGASAEQTAYRLSKGWTTEQALGLVAAPAMPGVVIHGVLYPSAKAAAKKHNLTYSGLRHRMAKGMSIEEALATPAAPTQGICIDYAGRQFSSVAELAATYELPVNLVHKRLNAGWSTADAVERPSRARHCVEWQGARYPSLRAAALALGLCYGTLKGARRRSGQSVQDALATAMQS